MPSCRKKKLLVILLVAFLTVLILLAPALLLLGSNDGGDDNGGRAEIEFADPLLSVDIYNPEPAEGSTYVFPENHRRFSSPFPYSRGSWK